MTEAERADEDRAKLRIRKERYHDPSTGEKEKRSAIDAKAHQKKKAKSEGRQLARPRDRYCKDKNAEYPEPLRVYLQQATLMLCQQFGTKKSGKIQSLVVQYNQLIMRERDALLEHSDYDWKEKWVNEIIIQEYHDIRGKYLSEVSQSLPIKWKAVGITKEQREQAQLVRKEQGRLSDADLAAYVVSLMPPYTGG